MLKKIVEIKNLGVFKHYRWNASIPEFDRFNIIYGWNGSGKTTLSQLFSSFESGKLAEFPEMKYKIETEDGEYTQDLPYIKQVRVFNQQYISENIDVVGGKANPIFILGEENKKLAEVIEKDQRILRGDPRNPNDLGKLKELGLKKNELDQLEKERGKHFTDIAKVISSSIQGMITRTYNKNHAENDFNQLSSKQILSEDEFNNCIATSRQQEMKIVETIDFNEIQDELKAILADAKKILADTVESTRNCKIKR